METVSLTIPESGEITTAAQAALQQARSFIIDSAEKYADANGYRDYALERVEQGETLFKDAKDIANKLHKRIVDLYNKATAPWSEAAKLYKGKMIAWDEEQRRIQRQRQAEEDAKAKAQAEREQRELAATMRELGLAQQAAEVEAETPVVQAPTVPRETQSAIVYRSNWTFEIVCITCSTKTIMRWVKYGDLQLHRDHQLDISGIPLDYMTPDWVKIGKLVRALKGETRIGGIRPIEEHV